MERWYIEKKVVVIRKVSLAACRISRKLFSFLFRKTERSYKELEARKSRLRELEKIYMDMAMQKELQVLMILILMNLYVSCICRLLIEYSIYEQKKGRKRKLREDEIVNPTNKPVYKWRAERKRWKSP